jgi:hypothetical protein
LSPADFWSGTFEDVLFVIGGTVDNWRVQRRAAWKICEALIGTDKMPEIYDFFPLTFDEELKHEADTLKEESLEEWYKNIQGSGYFDNPISNGR